MRPTRRTPTLIGCMLGMGTVALDSTVLATAIPSIVDELGGFTAYPWVFSVNFLAQAITIPIFGKMADSIGRRPVLLIGAGLFLGGALLSSLAWSMSALIVTRAVQGLGAGAIQPVTQTIVGDIYEVHERGKPQGLMSSVWGLSAIIGPGVGGVLVDYVDWRWIFYLGFPVGVAAVVMIIYFLREPEVRARRGPRKPADLLGTALLTLAVGVLILGLLQSGIAWPLVSVQTAVLLGVAAILLWLFVWQERRAPDPVIPSWVLRTPALASVCVQAVVIGMLMIGTAAYLPAFVQVSLGTSAVVAGFALTIQSFGWPFASAASARLYLRIGFRGAAATGSATTVAACAGLALIPRGGGVVYVMVCSFVLGIGLGLQMTPLLVGVQHAVQWHRRGVMTGVFVFARTVGSALGAALFGALAHSASTTASAPEVFDASRRVFLGLAVAAGIGLLVALCTRHFGPNAAPERRVLIRRLRNDVSHKSTAWHESGRRRRARGARAGQRRSAGTDADH